MFPDYQSFLQQKTIELKSNAALDRQAKFESNARSYPRRIPISIARAKGIYLEDTNGNIFIDCLAGAGSLTLGHNHPIIQQAMREHIDQDLPLLTLDITSPAKDQFIVDLFKLLPEPFAKDAKIHFCSPSGADAIEAAIKLVKTATGRQTIWSFSGAYHGMTHGALSVSGSQSTKAPISNLMPGVQILPFPYMYRCPFGLEGKASIQANLHYIKQLLTDPESGVLPPAAVVVEAIQGEGGAIPAPVEWLKGLRKITNDHDIPLILDEVQSGVGRSGKMFAYEYAGIVPDVITLSKAIGGGLPLSVMVYRKSLDQWSAAAHTGTFRGNQLAMTGGSKTLQFVMEERLDQHAAIMGDRLKTHLEGIQKNCAYIGDVRGYGLMLGVEIVDPRPTASALNAPPPCFPELASAIQQQCLLNGLILETGGRHDSTLRFLPPLIINEEEIDLVADIFDRSIQQAITQLKL